MASEAPTHPVIDVRAFILYNPEFVQAFDPNTLPESGESLKAIASRLTQCTKVIQDEPIADQAIWQMLTDMHTHCTNTLLAIKKSFDEGGVWKNTSFAPIHVRPLATFVSALKARMDSREKECTDVANKVRGVLAGLLKEFDCHAKNNNELTTQLEDPDHPPLMIRHTQKGVPIASSIQAAMVVTLAGICDSKSFKEMKQPPSKVFLEFFKSMTTIRDGVERRKTDRLPTAIKSMLTATLKHRAVVSVMAPHLTQPTADPKSGATQEAASGSGSKRAIAEEAEPVEGNKKQKIEAEPVADPMVDAEPEAESLILDFRSAEEKRAAAEKDVQAPSTADDQTQIDRIPEIQYDKVELLAAVRAQTQDENIITMIMDQFVEFKKDFMEAIETGFDVAHNLRSSNLTQTYTALDELVNASVQDLATLLIIAAKQVTGDEDALPVDTGAAAAAEAPAKEAEAPAPATEAAKEAEAGPAPAADAPAADAPAPATEAGPAPAAEPAADAPAPAAEPAADAAGPPPPPPPPAQ